MHINIALQIKATVHPRRQIRASLRKSSDVRNRRITRNGHRRLAISTSDPRSDRGIISRNTKHHPMQPCYSHRCNRSERNAFNEGCNRQILFPRNSGFFPYSYHRDIYVCDGFHLLWSWRCHCLRNSVFMLRRGTRFGKIGRDFRRDTCFRKCPHFLLAGSAVKNHPCRLCSVCHMANWKNIQVLSSTTVTP